MPGTDQLAQLASRRVVVRLQGLPAEHDQEALSRNGRTHLGRILQVGMMHLNPERQTCMSMTVLTETGEVDGAGQKLHMKAPGRACPLR